jgi:putative ATP-dependent endonuclease of the OLD family
MRISKIEIDNFRNFHHLELHLGPHAVIVGENKIGKSNLLYALRLILDSRMPDSARRLRLEDFWDGLPRPLTRDDFIRVTIDLTDFEDDQTLLAVLAEHLVEPDPMISRLTYLYRPLPALEHDPKKESDYEFLVYGGDRIDNQIGFTLRQWIPLTVLPALRNAEEDLANWRQSPLAPLLRAAAANIDADELDKVAQEIFAATSRIGALPDVKSLSDQIRERLEDMVGPTHGVDTSLGFSPTDKDRLVRSLRIFIDGGKRGISDASLGCANLIYLTLLSLELERQVHEGERSHTFLAIEEPEAHLHPHLQRLAFRDYLDTQADEGAVEIKPKPQTILLTTHSPHIVSVAPLKSLVILKSSADGHGTIGSSTARLELDHAVVKDLERYLDVSRGECVFAKGILLVEGAAEEFLIPALAKLRGLDFDRLGVTVCSVNGTNFTPYVKLFGPNGFDLPVAVLTDYDPQDGGKPPLSRQRVISLLSVYTDGAPPNGVEAGALEKFAETFGILVNEYTLEVDLFRSGAHEVMSLVLGELTANGAAKARALHWQQHPDQLDAPQFLKDITEVGKGRYAQRLASQLTGEAYPGYIQRAIEYVAARIH